MKINNNLYWSIISPRNLLQAWNTFRSDKRNKLDVATFELDLERNIFDLHRVLRARTYKHGPYKGFWIHDPKLRRIHKATVRDRVLHHAVFAILYPIFDPTFIHTSYSCRIDKGSHRGVSYLRNAVRKVSQNYTKPCYVLKCDIRKFFDNVDHEILLGIIQVRIKDAATFSLIEKIIRSYYTGIIERERERVQSHTKRHTAW